MDGQEQTAISKDNLPKSALTFKAGAYKQSSSSLGIVPQDDTLGSRTDIGSTGWSGVPLSNIQPSLCLYYMIKI